MQGLIENLKKRAAALKAQTEGVLVKPTEVSLGAAPNYKEIKTQLTEEMEGLKDLLQARVDELTEAISKLEDEQRPIEEVLDSVKELLVTLDDMPEQG